MEREAKFLVPCDDDIVITGISGKFPKSDNLDDFKYHLYNGINMATDDCSRWTPGTTLIVIIFYDSIFIYR